MGQRPDAEELDVTTLPVDPVVLVPSTQKGEGQVLPVTVVRRADDQHASWTEQANRGLDEVCRPVEMLDHITRNHQIEGAFVFGRTTSVDAEHRAPESHVLAGIMVTCDLQVGGGSILTYDAVAALPNLCCQVSRAAAQVAD